MPCLVAPQAAGLGPAVCDCEDRRRLPAGAAGHAGKGYSGRTVGGSVESDCCRELLAMQVCLSLPVRVGALQALPRHGSLLPSLLTSPSPCCAQLIRTFHDIFAEAQLPLWLRPFEVG